MTNTNQPTTPEAGDLIVIRGFTCQFEAPTKTHIYYGRVVGVDDTHLWYREEFDGVEYGGPYGKTLADMTRDKEPAEMPTEEPRDWKFKR